MFTPKQSAKINKNSPFLPNLHMFDVFPYPRCHSTLFKDAFSQLLMAEFNMITLLSKVEVSSCVKRNLQHVTRRGAMGVLDGLVLSMFHKETPVPRVIPSRELTYPTFVKGKPSSTVPFWRGYASSLEGSC